jgi:CheY-like chemotaxis protein
MNTQQRILVATDVVSDADLIQRLLHDKFENIVVSTDHEHAVEDFEKNRPEVLILAFKNLEKADRYYLELSHLSSMFHAVPHRALVLCNKDELRQVYELCKEKHFDDYILFWPMTDDAAHLPVAMNRGLHQMVYATMLGGNEIVAQAQRLADLESLLERYAANGSQHEEAASRSLRQPDQDSGAATPRFFYFFPKLSKGGHGDLRDIKYREALQRQREINRLKAEESEKRAHASAAAAKHARPWDGVRKDDFDHQSESARALQRLAEHIRPLVLVVEDDELQQKILKQMLAEINLDLVFTTTGREALASLHKHRPDLILMDLGLPDIDGIETTRRLKSIEHFAKIPVIMITGHSEKAVVVESLKAGASGFAVKPFEKDVLLAKVRGFLNGVRDETHNPPGS